MTKKSRDDELIDKDIKKFDDIKKFKQNIEQRFVLILPLLFMHKHRRIVQTSWEKKFNRKEIKDETMLIIFFSQYEWTNSLTDVPNKINDIFTLFIVISNMTDVLIKEVLTDFTFLIIKENINCNNFLNKNRFNLSTERVKYKFLTDIIISNERVYERNFILHILTEWNK